MFDLISSFYEKVEARGIDWEAKGFVFRDKTVYSINHDTKLLGRIFEILSEPILEEIAEEHKYALETPDKQNYYPDFILSPIGEAKHKIAIDIKSTYRSYRADGTAKPIKFTLGSYASFLRNGTKNIAYSYEDYDRHYVIGFAYDRNESAKNSLRYSINDLDLVPQPYSNVEFFIQEKYRIAGFGTGSGNTENIGTISTSNFDDFREGNGPFAEMGNEVFEFYWRNYPRYKAPKKLYTGFEDFALWVLDDETDCEDKIKQPVREYYLSKLSD